MLLNQFGCGGLPYFHKQTEVKRWEAPLTGELSRKSGMPEEGSGKHSHTLSRKELVSYLKAHASSISASAC